MGETHPTKAELEEQRIKREAEEQKRKQEEEERQREYKLKLQKLEKEKKEEERKKLEVQEKIRRENEERKNREKKERERKEKELKIQQLRDSQDITTFLNLIKEFRNNYDYEYLKKTLDAFNEKEIINKYNYIKEEFSSHIQLINEIIFHDNIDKIDLDCLKKLMIILLFYEKLKSNIEEIIQKSLEKKKLKNLIFDILLEYSELFGEDIKFVNISINIYKEFVAYSITKGRYTQSLKYLNNNIIQLKLLYSNIDEIFDTEQKIIYEKLNDYKEADKIINDLIEYQENKKRQFIFFPKIFWENYYSYYKTNENDYIKKIFKLYKLLLFYKSLGEDDTEYKYELAEKIHNNIENKIKDNKLVKEQIELLFNYDPYYKYNEFKAVRDPKIFENISIYNLKTDDDIKYFHKYNLEDIYLDKFKDYLKIIVEMSDDLVKLNTILKLTIIIQQDNKDEYINLLLNKYKNINEIDLNDECENSFINFFDKVIEYTPKKKLEIINDCLILFRNNYSIYLKIIEKYKDDHEIQEQITKSTNKNLENIDILIELIKNIKDEEQKKEYFNNLNERIITYDEFLKKEDSDNLKLLTQLIKKNLIPESIYLDKNKDILNTIYDKLSNYDEKKSIYLNTILNKKEEVNKIYENRFDLIRLAKDDKFNPKTEFKKIIDKYIQVKEYIEKAHNISYQLSFYYKVKLKNDIDKINSIYSDYSNKDIELNKWIEKEEDIIRFIKKFEKKADLIKTLKEIILFKIIYGEFTEGDEIIKFDNSKKLLDECKIIFTDINKGNLNILNRWQNYFKREKGINDELKKLKDYYKINDTENTDKIAKNIMIFTKKNIYYEDIKCLLNFLKLFEVKETELSNILNEKKLEFEDKENLIDFEKLEKINTYLEDKNIYINDGKDDSCLIRLIRLLSDKQNQINFVKSKDVDSAAALIYRLNPTSDSLRFEDILQYQNCVSFINDIKAKVEDNELLIKIKEKLKKDNIDVVLFSFRSYFINYESIKALDDFDSTKDVYQDITKILNNSIFKIQLFKKEFKVYDDNKQEIKINAKDLDGLIELKDNINLNFENLPDKINEDKKKEIELKRNRIKIFVKYIMQLQTIIKYFTILENKGCPFLIDILVSASKDNIMFELVSNKVKYYDLIFKLKDYCNAMAEFQLKFYKENEYFRFVYEKQLYRLFKRTRRKDKDISSYIRFFTNGDSIKDDVPFYESKFSDQSKAYQYYRVAIEENFELISKYIEYIFKINDTSLKKLYENIKVKESFNLKGIYKCNIQKSNMDLFIIKMFLKLTDLFPIAQNILLTNSETGIGEIYSFMYRAIKCRFNTLFIISISDDCSIQNINIMTNLVNQIISDMKRGNIIKTIEDLKPCILFVINKKNILGNSRGILDVKEIKELPDYIKGEEDKLEYTLKNEGENEIKNNSQKGYSISSNTLTGRQKDDTKSDKSIKYNEIYESVKIFTSDCSGLGKSKLIKKKIKENGEDYYYLGIGDDITKDGLFKKLKKMIKRDIKGKRKVGVHLDLFYTKNIPLMQYFLFSFLITKLYQVSDNILYIPKNINIYVEIPNGPQKFVDDFPLLNIFETINISLDNQEPLDIDENTLIKLVWTDKKDNIDKDNIIEEGEKPMTYIEKQIYMNIINYLSSSKEDDRQKYYEDVKKTASYLIKCVFSDTVRKPDESLKNKTQKEQINYLFDFLDFKDKDALKIQYNAPLIFKSKDGYIKIDIPKYKEKVDDKEKKKVEQNIEDGKGNNDDKIIEYDDNEKDLDYYLSNLKEIMSLEQSIEEIKEMIGEYKITEDNYKKMLFILFRIFSNIPVILMGETGCGKTELIKQLIKMLNKGDEEFLIIKNMHSGVKENEIEEVIDAAEKKLQELNCNIVCIFFDEINTTSLLSKMKEIFVNHSLNGKAINEKIRFIGACNPFRRKETKEREVGLKMDESSQQMTYLVNPLPNSLLNYIFYFKSLEDSDTIKYIQSIIGAEFPKGENKESENSIFRSEVISAIFQSHNFVRNANGKSSVSLRDLQRFKRAYKFFNKYYEYKVEFMKDNEESISDKVEIQSKIQSFVLSLFITYYIRIFKSGYESNYLQEVNPKIIKITESLLGKEHIWSKNKNWEKEPFKELIKKEEEFLIKEMQIENEKGIGINTSLMENIFLMFFSIFSHIPLIVVGKPGCSKSLSIQLIIRIMRGEFSNSNFLKKYAKINSTGFQGSETNTPESIERIFEVAENKIDKTINDEEKIISLLIFDELGLSERSPTNCLKVLHSKLEMSLNPKVKNLLSFIGISNWRLDAAKMNRTIFLSIPDMKLDDINSTVKAIAKSYHEEIYNKYEKEYISIGKYYFDYKEALKKKYADKKDDNNDNEKNNQENLTNEEKLNREFILNFHGGRDLYHLVKVFSSEMMKNNMSEDSNIIDTAIKRSFARNLGGLEIDGENIAKQYIKDIKFDDVKTIDLIKDNIQSKESRFLLLVSERSMFDFLMNIIKNELEQMNKENSNKNPIKYVNYIGSPFKGDKMNISYQTEMIVNIENSVAEGKVIILSNLEQIYSIFYDLFNQNYFEKDKKKYCRISHGANIQKLALVNENTKFIILVDNNDLRKQKLPFLSRFEKHIIKFDILLDKKDKEKSEIIHDLLKKMVSIKGINYNMNNILVNTNQDIINGYVYLYKDKEKNSYKNIIEDKIIPIIPQDIIFTLPYSDLKDEKNNIDFIKKNYSNYVSLKEYLESDKRGKEEILIVYTFSGIGQSIVLNEKEKEKKEGKEIKESYMEKVASEIKSVFKFKQILNDFYEIKEYNTLILKFEKENAVNINFFISAINHYKEINQIKCDNNKKYIFTVSVQRQFDSDNTNKITTVLITDENIKQLFIDNINGTQSIKEIEGKSINDIINKGGNLNPKKLIIEGMLKFYGENNNEQIGKYKGINTNNLIREFKIFIENSDYLIDQIKSIILSQINKSEKIVNLIIENKSINQNTIDFSSAILKYIEEAFNDKIKQLLIKSENNNFFVTLFMLNIKDLEKGDSILNSSSIKLNDYSFNKTDEQLLKNELFKKIQKEFLKKLKEEKDEKNNDASINIKLYYKIPAFFNIYKEIKKYIQDEKLALQYRQDETDIRKNEYEYSASLMAKLKNESKEFTDKIYVELASKQLVTKVVEAKIDDQNYIEFTEVFLNDYITFYLVNLYKNAINDFVVNDVQHKIILLLLDLKFKGLCEEEKFNIPLQNVVSQILWLEGNVNYIKDILDLYNIISENILYDKKEEEILFKEILNYISQNEIKYEPKEKQLIKVNVPYYIIFITLFKCMINKKSIDIAVSKNDNYYSYFENLEICLKIMNKLDKILKLDINELKILDEFLMIYNAFEHSGKINKLNLNELIDNFTKNLEVIEKNEENKISSLCENLKKLIENINESIYDSSKNNEIKGDKVYYELISNIILNEIKRENSIQYKIYILNEFLLKDEKLFIQSNKLLKEVLDDFVSPNINLFQGSLDKLSDLELKKLEDSTNNDWIKETLIYTFEQISVIYIENRINQNENEKKENKKNILYDLKSFLENCVEFLEKLYKDPELIDIDDKIKININLKKIFAISFTRIYLKIFIDWINKNKLKKNEIKEIIDVINGKENNEFRDMLMYYILKILYNINQQDISKLYDENIIEKFNLKQYNNFELILKEQNNQESAKHIVFVEAYKQTDEDYKIFKEEFDLLTLCLNNSGDKENELKNLIKNNNRIDIFYSVFSAKMCAYTGDKDKINLLSNIIHNIFEDKEKLTNIFDLFLDKTKYTKANINSNILEILQFSLKFCINADDIIDDYNNIYYPLYSGDKEISSYIPGNDIKNNKIYDCYSKIKRFLNDNPSNYGVYVCICNIKEENEEIYIEFIKGTGYPEKAGKCKYCQENTGNDGNPNSFYDRDNYYRIFKNEQDLEKETKNKGNGNCITLEKFFRDYLYEKLDKDSIGINISNKSHFDKTDKPIRNQSQLSYRLMNLILYSHLFTNILFTNKDEIFASQDITYLDYIKSNWNKLNKILESMGINIHAFMNLIFKDLFKCLNNHKLINTYDELLEIEKEIENIIENKITKKAEKIKDKEFTKYAIFGNFYVKMKDYFRDKNLNNRTSIIKEINSPENYKEEKYPYYKSFLYSDYPDETFLKNKLEEIDKEKYPVIDLYLNREKQKNSFNKEFIIFNFVIKSLLNQYSYKISREEAKKLTFEKSYIYKNSQKQCELFIKIINSKKDIKIKKEKALFDFFIDSSTDYGKLYKKIYNEYAKYQNDSLNKIIEKINNVNFDIFECQEINIQEAQKGDLLILDFENKSEFLDILLTNTIRDFYNPKSKIKYNNYNLFSIDFDKIEKVLENVLIKNACFLKTDEIVEMIYTGEEFLNDGISEFNQNITLENLDERDKKEFISFYEKYLKENLDYCLEIHEGIQNIISYVNKNYKKINNKKAASYIINEGGFHYKINDNFKAFLSNNTNITINKLSNLMIYLEKLYFKLAIDKKGGEFTEKLNDDTKNKIDKYYNDINGQFITKEKLSFTIIRFLLNLIINQKNNRAGIIEGTDKLLDYLDNKFLWDNKVYNDNKFIKEIKEYKNFDILVKNAYDFYSYISNDCISRFENEITEILENIKNDENEKLRKEKIKEREEAKKKILEIKDEPNEEQNNIQVDDDDIDDIPDI